MTNQLINQKRKKKLGAIVKNQDAWNYIVIALLTDNFAQVNAIVKIVPINKKTKRKDTVSCFSWLKGY